MQYASAKKWKDNPGEVQVIEYHNSIAEAIDFIKKQPKPVGNEFEWLVGEYK